MRNAAASGLVTVGASQVSAMAGSGTCGPVTATARSLFHAGSSLLARSSGLAGRAIWPKYLSTQASSCFGSKSPATTSVALSGR